MNINNYNFDNLISHRLDEEEQEQVKTIYPVLMEIGLINEYSQEDLERFKAQMPRNGFGDFKEARARNILETNISANIETCIKVLEIFNQAAIYENYEEYKDLILINFENMEDI